jgi:PTS system nitrogen regulatory IIA component
MAGRTAGLLKIDGVKLTEELFKREELDSTGMGSGVAIPMRKPIDFEAGDDEPVDVVFMLAKPANQNALAATTGIARVPRLLLAEFRSPARSMRGG